MEGNWEVLAFDSDYEIFSEFPYPIRRKGSDKIQSEFIDSQYINTTIKRKRVLKHRLIALQWIDNEDPQNKTQVDHIDRNKLNNHVNNLRWVSHSENMRNRDYTPKRELEYIERLPENVIQVNDFEEIQLDRYYYDIDNERLLFETRNRKRNYRIIYPCLISNQLCITLVDSNGNRMKRSYTRFMNHLRDIL